MTTSFQSGQDDPFRARRWHVGHGREIALGPTAVVMGILNVTPDSFSDGGRFGGSVPRAVDAAMRMVADGAAIVDVGGESTRPGAEPVTAAEESRRVLPVVEALAQRCDCLISIDTYRAETAEAALRAGAHIVNDVWGAQRDPRIAAIAARHHAGLCLMHTGRERDRDADVVADQHAFLVRSLAIAATAGVPPERIVLDPGFGFAKDERENVALMERLDALHALNHPLLVGTSRKRFVRALVAPDGDADRATAATSVVLRLKGAAVFRVHDVAGNRDALRVADAVIAARGQT